MEKEEERMKTVIQKLQVKDRKVKILKKCCKIVER